MRRPFSILSLAVAWSVFAGATQLGPKDGPTVPPNDVSRVKVGEPAPDFTLEDMHGRPVTLSSFRGKSVVVIAFYRGHW